MSDDRVADPEHGPEEQAKRERQHHEDADAITGLFELHHHCRNGEANCSSTGYPQQDSHCVLLTI
jgi:hypothetical protein